MIVRRLPRQATERIEIAENRTKVDVRRTVALDGGWDENLVQPVDLQTFQKPRSSQPFLNLPLGRFAFQRRMKLSRDDNGWRVFRASSHTNIYVCITTTVTLQRPDLTLWCVNSSRWLSKEGGAVKKKSKIRMSSSSSLEEVEEEMETKRKKRSSSPSLLSSSLFLRKLKTRNDNNNDKLSLSSNNNKKKRKRSPPRQISNTSLLFVEAKPPIKDPREFLTILTSSLRSLFGELEYHSCQLQVVIRKGNVVLVEGNDRGSGSATAEPSSKMMVMTVTCSTESVAAVRAALTMVTPPPYLSDSVYRFDVVKVEKKRNE